MDSLASLSMVFAVLHTHTHTHTHTGKDISLLRVYKVRIYVNTGSHLGNSGCQYAGGRYSIIQLDTGMFNYIVRRPSNRNVLLMQWLLLVLNGPIYRYCPIPYCTYNIKQYKILPNKGRQYRSPRNDWRGSFYIFVVLTPPSPHDPQSSIN